MNETITSKMIKRNKKEQGQVLIILAFSFIVLLLFVGLAIDLGFVFIRRLELYRATDAAVLAAAGQIREGRTFGELRSIATEVMELNGASPETVVIETCETAIVPGDPDLCKVPRRKLVRITSEASVPLTFMRLVGVYEVGVSAEAIGEAASMDVVLVIDISESMTWDANPDDPMRDPFQCNNDDPTGTDGYPGSCQPFQDVKIAAAQFASRILNKAPALEEDRLAIVTFANGWSSNKDEGTHYRTAGWSNDKDQVLNIIENLSVYEPGVCFDEFGNEQTHYGACRQYDYTDPANPIYMGFNCISCWVLPDYSTLTSTNIGGGLLLAGNMFALQTREDSLWVVVLLTDGMANATIMDSGDDITNFATYPIGYCPYDPVPPLCQDKDVSFTHSNTSPLYNADDYARDMANFVGCLPLNPAGGCDGQAGQGAVIFAIGLGDGVLIHDNEVHNRPYGASLLRYIAAVGYDGDPDTDPCAAESNYETWCGNYYYSPTGSQLNRVFEDIASRIFTRITH